MSDTVKVKGEFNPEEFRIKFKAFLAVLAFIAAMVFLLVAMINTAAQTSKYTGTIIGFVTGTLITLIFSYYFGSSEPIQPISNPPLPEKPTRTVIKNRIPGSGSDLNVKGTVSNE